MTLRTWFSVLSLTLLASFSLNGDTAATAAEPPQLFADSDIVSLELSGGPFTLPLGPNWSDIDVMVGASCPQDHNSSRSNKTGSIISPGDPNDPDPINPHELDGTSYRLESFFDIFFELSFDSPQLSLNYGGGGPLVVETDSAVQLANDPPAPFVFDKHAPLFGMLDTRALEHRGHVTVLKIALGGDEDLDGVPERLSINGGDIVFNPMSGTEKFTLLPDGSMQHTFDVQLSISGVLEDDNTSIPFVFGPLTGTVVEVGSLRNALVPEPGSLALCGLVGAATLGWRRRRPLAA